MLIDAQDIEDGTTSSCDVLVVGGGAAGIALGLSLSGTRLRVTILESGGTSFERETQALYRGAIVGLRYEPLDLCRVRTLGGSTDRQGWAGWCRMFRPVDFESRDGIALSGWPMPFEELQAHYGPALDIFGLSHARFTDTPPGLSGFDSGLCENDWACASPAPQLGERWKETLAASSNVTVVLHANVVGIDTDDASAQVQRVSVATLRGRRFAATGRVVVLAAGGIETPRLMLATTARSDAGLGNRSGWVGRCFMDHPRFAWGQIVSAPDPLRLRDYDPTHGLGRDRSPDRSGRWLGLASGISPRAEVLRERGLLGSRSWIVPVSPQGERPGGRELRELVLWTLLRRRMPSDALLRTRMVLADLPNAVGALVAHVQSIRGRSTRWQFVTTLEPEPNPDSRVLLDTATDRFGMPRVKLDWRLTPACERALAEAQSLVVNDLRALGIDARIEGPGGARANQTIREPRWTWHHMGTTRMASDPRLGVVDPNCRVHGMENLYIAGSSVFPTSSTDMPTLTIVALAHRLADHLKAKLSA